MSDDSNDDPKHNRKNIPNHSPSPMGTVRKREDTQFIFELEDHGAPEGVTEIDLSRNDIDLEEKALGTSVLLKFNRDGPCPEGIDGGRITRMTITQGKMGDEEILAHFDNGEWVQEPETPLGIQVMMRMKKQENGLEMPDVKPAFDQALEQKPKLKP